MKIRAGDKHRFHLLFYKLSRTLQSLPPWLIGTMLLSSISSTAKETSHCHELFNAALGHLEKSSPATFHERLLAMRLTAEAEKEFASIGITPKSGHGDPEVWTVDGPSGGDSYNEVFREISEKLGTQDPKPIKAILQTQRKQFGKADTLDLFGSGFVFQQDPNATSVTGLRFGPYRANSVDRPLKDNVLAPPEVLGDIFHSSTWTRLTDSMTRRKIESMDLVTMNPVGGWAHEKFSETVHGNRIAIQYILAQLIPRLNPDGTFLFSLIVPQLPGDLAKHPEFLDLISRIETSFPGRRLTLGTRLSVRNSTYRLFGALHPKKKPPRKPNRK